MANEALTIFSNIITIIVIMAFGYIESGNAIGGAVALIIAILASLSALIGFIPIIGPYIHYSFLYPAIQGAILSFQPGIHMPITLLFILIVTTIFAVIYTIVTFVLIAVVGKNL